MAVLRTTLAMTMAMLAGCYSPDLRDCVVACTSSDDCGPDQICGADGRCAAPDVAGSCSATAPLPDAGTDGAPSADAAPDAPPDGPPLALLVVQIAGKGMVTVMGVGTCNYNAPSHQCTYPLLANTEVEIVATGTNGDEFDRWQSMVCAGEDATCTATVAPPSTTVNAKFSH
jgi:hypothetical protein